MSRIFRNAKGKEVRFSEKEYEEMFKKTTVSDVINIPKDIDDDNHYFEVVDV